MTGHMDSDGVFHADELLLKCPTKYQEASDPGVHTKPVSSW